MSYFRNRLNYYGENVPIEFYNKNKNEFEEIFNLIFQLFWIFTDLLVFSLESVIKDLIIFAKKHIEVYRPEELID